MNRNFAKSIENRYLLQNITLSVSDQANRNLMSWVQKKLSFGRYAGIHEKDTVVRVFQSGLTHEIRRGPRLCQPVVTLFIFFHLTYSVQELRRKIRTVFPFDCKRIQPEFFKKGF